MKSEILKNKLKNLLEDYIYEDLTNKSYKKNIILARDLISSNRIDLGFRILFLELKKKNINLAEKIYLEHLKALTFSTFTEKGHTNKNSQEKYLRFFNYLFENIKKYGFDETKSLIPVENSKSILNGSHRLAIAIFLNINVSTISIEKDKLYYDYKFFNKRNVNIESIENAINCLIKYNDNIRLAILWPTSFDFHNQITKEIKNIYYEKIINFSDIGKHNFIIELYKNETWLGSHDDNFQGAKNKMLLCFAKNKPLKILIFEKKNSLDLVKFKNKIREKIGYNKNSIHISDNNKFQNITEILFNKNSLKFINSIKFSKLKQEFKIIEKFKKILKENNLNFDDILIVGSFPLALFNLRKNQDIDILINNDYKINKNTDEISINNHDNYIKYFESKKEDLLYDNSNYFYFNRLKVLSLSNLKIFKKNRSETKDHLDLDLISKIETKYKKKFSIKNLFRKIIYYYQFYRYRVIIFLIKIKLYDILKKILLK